MIQALAGAAAMYVLGGWWNTHDAPAARAIRRDGIGAGASSWYDQHEPYYPAYEGGLPPLSQMKNAYNGSALPVATCKTPGAAGCHDVYYRHYAKSDGSLIHHLAVTPAGARSKDKRDCIGCGHEGTVFTTDNTGEYYVDYYFDQGVADEDYQLATDTADGGLVQHVRIPIHLSRTYRI